MKHASAPRWLVVLGLSALGPLGVAAGGCGGTDNVSIGDGGGDGGGPGADAADTFVPDTTPPIDGGPIDGGRDARGPDSAGDAPSDSFTDGTIDAPADTNPDVTVDSGPDVMSDVVSDVVGDVRVDAPPPDTGIDTGVDSGGDASDAGDAGDGGDGGVVCSAPPAGQWYVAPSGDDATGTGSQTCPFQTITHAIAQVSAASPASIIWVAAGTYGSGCTAGPGHCDATPIVVAGVAHGLIFAGAGANATLVVGGTTTSDTSVFEVSSPTVSFIDLTVAPRRVASGVGPARIPGAVGILFDAPAAFPAAEGAVQNVLVQGIPLSATSDSTSSGIVVRGGTSPTLGPGVTIFGGDHSVLVTDAPTSGMLRPSAPTITGGTNAPDFFHSAQFACVRVQWLDMNNAPPSLAVTSSDPMGPVHLQDCGGNGGIVVDDVMPATNIQNVTVDTTIIDATGGAPADYGIRLVNYGALQAGLTGSLLSVNIGGMNVAGIEAVDNSALTILGGVLVQNGVHVGVHVGGTASASIDGLTSQTNGTTAEDPGLLCDSTGQGANGAPPLYLRDSVFLGNAGSGVVVRGPSGSAFGCTADLGSATSNGNNTFNVTATRNGVTGLCYLTPSANPATPTSSTWSCGQPSGSGCASGVPTAGVTCDPGTDYSNGGTGGLTVAPPQTCCGN